MQSGALNRRIEIQTQTSIVDAAGQPKQQWLTAYHCWAGLDIQNSQLIYATAEFIAKVVYRITVRWSYSNLIQPNMRVVYKEPRTGVIHKYNIESLLNTKQRNQELVLLCYELGGKE